MERAGRALAQSTLAMTKRLLASYGERITGSEKCREAARAIADTLRGSCDSVAEETFTLHPAALWNVGRAAAVTYCAAFLLAALGGWLAYAAAAICLVCLAYVVTQYIVCGRLFDGIFPRAQGCNVSGTIEPREEVRSQVLVVGHHDSPYVLSFLLRAQQFASLRLISAMAAFLFLTGESVWGSLRQALTGVPWRLEGIPLWLEIAGILLAAPLFFLVKRVPSPGAGDNLNASSIAMSVAERISSRGKRGLALRHCRVVFLSTDGEEAGQRGAIAYAERHRSELHSVPTFVLNIDSVYGLSDLSVLTRDRHGTRALSKRMAARLCALAAELGYPLQKKPLPFGGGGTDAAAFARIGIESSALIGVSTSFFSKGLVYHTPFDTAERIQPEAVEAVLDLALNYILITDAER